MKKRFAFILIAFISILSSCEKDPIISNDKNVGISKITYYANITLTGNTTISVVKGTAFTDPGVKAEAGGKDIPVITTGTVNTAAVGLYTLDYSATNADGFSSSATRTVVVIPSAEVAGVDLSGSYSAVSASAGNATINKLAPGVYFTTNCWNGATTIPAYFISTDGMSLIIPTQSTAFGRLETTMPGTYSPSGLIIWQLDLLDQGPLVRTRKWQKQ